MALQAGAILRGAEKTIVFNAFRGNSAGSQNRQQGHANSGDVALASAFGDEAATRLERPAYSLENGILIAHPVQGSIGKDGIELLIEGQRFPAHTARIDPSFFGCGDHLR